MPDIESMIAAALGGDYATASKEFEGIMATKVGDALEDEKSTLAAEIYNDYDREEDLDDEDEDLEEDDLEEEDVE